jgi:hypothetical protein
MVMFNLIWWYAQHNDLVDKSLDLKLRQAMARSYLLGSLVYLFAVGLSLVNIEMALVLYILIPALYILTPPFEHLLLANHNKAEDRLLEWTLQTVRGLSVPKLGLLVPVGTEVEWDKLFPPGFQPQPMRWNVERAFAWVTRLSSASTRSRGSAAKQ